MDEPARRLRRFLADGPRRADELKRFLAAEGFPAITWPGIGHWVEMVRVPPSGTWEQRRADLYGLAADWIADPKPTERQGLEHIVRRYLGGFGPASINDIAGFAGLNVSAFGSVVERLTLRRFQDERGTELLDLPRAPLPHPSTPAPVRFLPTWEATLLVHARRTQILPESYRPLVFNTKTPHSVPTFLIDGGVAGTWRYERGRIQLKPFEPIPRVARRELDDEARHLAAFHAD
jgi:hypothetical protein